MHLFGKFSVMKNVSPGKHKDSKVVLFIDELSDVKQTTVNPTFSRSLIIPFNSGIKRFELFLVTGISLTISE